MLKIIIEKLEKINSDSRSEIKKIEKIARETLK